MTKKPIAKKPSVIAAPSYGSILSDVVELLNAARRAAARSVNSIMTATYWGIGGRIVEFEQGGHKRAEYGKALLQRLSSNLTARSAAGSGSTTWSCSAFFTCLIARLRSVTDCLANPNH